MHTEHHRWHSPRLNRDMELKVYGHWGKPYIVFPSSRGRYFDFEGMGMVAAIAGFIESRARSSSTASTAWTANRGTTMRCRRRNATPATRPTTATWSRRSSPSSGATASCRTQRVMATGCSMGAYHAVNFFLKHPDLFEGTIALSGLYRLDRPEFNLGPADLPAVYHNSPDRLPAKPQRPGFPGLVPPQHDHRLRGPGRLGRGGHRGHARPGPHLPRKIDPRLGGLLGSGRQPRLALVVQADELLPGQAARVDQGAAYHRTDFFGDVRAEIAFWSFAGFLHKDSLGRRPGHSGGQRLWQATKRPGASSRKTGASTVQTLAALAAARVEAAAGGRVDRARHVAGQQDAVLVRRRGPAPGRRRAAPGCRGAAVRGRDPASRPARPGGPGTSPPPGRQMYSTRLRSWEMKM